MPRVAAMALWRKRRTEALKVPRAYPQSGSQHVYDITYMSVAAATSQLQTKLSRALRALCSAAAICFCFTVFVYYPKQKPTK